MKVCKESPGEPIAFAQRIIVWQQQQGRHDLPWQGTQDAYRIWLSEIMLQQTQVATVIDYYLRFLAHFPTVEALAAAPLEKVLELWAGLGYYARARNLHRCAQVLVAEHGGQFPRDPEKLAELPGIGRSTAAAIGAFAFEARRAILDGNVKRVLARCFAIEGFPGQASVERDMWALAESLLPAAGMGAYTQGLMDLGASVCARRRPFCPACPLYEPCIARQQGRQAELPVSRPRKPLPERESTVAVLSDGARVLLERRPPTGIWGGLLSLPEVEAVRTGMRQNGRELGKGEALPVLKHTFSHFHLLLRPQFFLIESGLFGASVNDSACAWQAISWAEINSAALPAPIRRILLACAAHR